MIKYGIRRFNTASYFQSPTSLSSSLKKKIAFAFDIDGVLIRGSKPLIEATKALNLLNQNDIPFILLTNGGGKLEIERTNELSKKLNIMISKDQIIQSHTPFKNLINNFKNVLIIGGTDENDKTRNVAKNYGFKNVIRTIDIIKNNSKIWPFHRFTFEQLNEIKFQEIPKIDCILVFNDSRDLGCDLQIILDLLISKDGNLGTRKSKFEINKMLEPSIPIFFSNGDFLWANDYPIPRFGQGALITVVEQLYRQITGGKILQKTVIGKPERLTYQYALQVLRQWSSKSSSSSSIIGNVNEEDTTSPFDKIYMIGDNPYSDIIGANKFGWESILVRTGVFKDEDLPYLSQELKPKLIYDNVFDAVDHIVKSNK